MRDIKYLLGENLISEQAKRNVIGIIWRRIDAAAAAGSPGARQDIYQLFRHRLEAGIAQRKAKPDARAALEEVIEQIEKDLAFNELVNSKLDEDPPMQAKSRQPRARQSTATMAHRTKPQISRWIAALLLCAVLAGSAYYFLLGGPVLQGSAARAGSVDLSQMTLDPGGKQPARAKPGFELLRSGEGAVLKVTGPMNLFSSETLPVDSDSRYELSVKLRVLAGPDGTPRSTRVLSGMSTYDAAGVLQTSQPGTHRYALFNNTVISSDKGWVKRTAIVTGAGNERVDQFRDGTHSIRLLVLANYGSGASNQLEIEHLSWKQLED